MRGLAKRALGGTAAILVCAGAYATKSEPDGNIYDVIPNRNIFGLKPETHTESPPPPKQPTALATIILNGISTITGYKLALLKAQLPAKAGEAPRERSLMLTEGQRDGDIQVLQIDEKTGRVKVNNFGTITTLTFEKNGVKELAAPTNTAVPTPTGPVPPVLPSSATPVVNSNVVYPGQKPLPTRFHPRVPAPATPAPATLAPPTTNVPLPTVVPQPTVPAGSQVTAPQHQMTPEEQAVMIELERELARQTSRPALAPQ